MARYGLWGGFVLFVVIALATQWNGDLLTINNGKGAVRMVLLALWLGFCGYSVLASRRENFFKTVRNMARLYWGRQIGADLYLSVFLSIGLVWLVTSSVTETILWSLAFIPFANMAILLFVILRLDDILAAFTLA
ncbi:MAG: hypothetical protein AAFX52_12740 [Pseudomonadota bacterium]